MGQVEQFGFRLDWFMMLSITLYQLCIDNYHQNIKMRVFKVIIIVGPVAQKIIDHDLRF